MSTEARLQAVEDRLAIYNLLAMHPLTGDTGERLLVDALYADDVVIDRGDGAAHAHDRDAMAEVLGCDEHRAAIDAGLAHFGNMPVVDVDGDTATTLS